MTTDGTIRLGWDNSQLQAGAAKAQGLFDKLKASVKGGFGGGIGAALGGGIGGALGASGILSTVKQIAMASVQVNASGDNLLDASRRLGTSAENLQRIDLLARLNDTDVNTVVNGLNRITRSLEDSSDPAITEAFSQLGIDMADFAAAEAPQQIIALAKGFQDARDQGRGLSDLYALMGKSFQELIPLLLTPVEEMRSTMQEAKVVSNEQIMLMARVSDSQETLIDKAKKLKDAFIGAQFASKEQHREIAAQVAEEIKLNNAHRQAAADVIRSKQKDAAETKAHQGGVAQANAQSLDIHRGRLERQAFIDERKASGKLFTLPPSGPTPSSLDWIKRHGPAGGGPGLASTFKFSALDHLAALQARTEKGDRLIPMGSRPNAQPALKLSPESQAAVIEELKKIEKLLEEK